MEWVECPGMGGRWCSLVLLRYKGILGESWLGLTYFNGVIHRGSIIIWAHNKYFYPPKLLWIRNWMSGPSGLSWEREGTAELSSKAVGVQDKLALLLFQDF